jgi:hypothetical protein
MWFERHSVTLTGTTATAGSIGYTPMLNGRLYSIRYSSGTSPVLGTTTVLTVTNMGTDEVYYAKAVGTSAVTIRPRMSVSRSTGGIIYNTTAATQPVAECGELANERLSISIGKTTASGLTGTFIIGIAL